MPKSKKRPSRQTKAPITSSFHEQVPAVTKEELHFALVCAVSAVDGKTPRKSFASKAQEAIDRGEVKGTRWFLKDLPENHMAFAIMEAFPEKTPAGDEKRKALLWRAMFAFRRVASDARYKDYVRVTDGQEFVASALMEAAATTPMHTANEVPVDEVFRRAADLVRQQQEATPTSSSYVRRPQMPKSKKRPRTRSKAGAAPSYQYPVIAVTKEELHFAMMAAAGVANGQTPRQSFQSKFEEAVDQGRLDRNKSYLRLTDARPNHMAFAILEAFPEKTPENEEKRRSLLWRVMFAFPEIASDPRFEQYSHEDNGEFFIEEAILEAAATTPMSAGKATPVDEVFRRAAELLRQEQAKSPD